VKELGDAKSLKDNTPRTLTGRELIYPAVAMWGGYVAKVTSSSGTQKAWVSTNFSDGTRDLVTMVQRLYDVVDTLWYERDRLCTLMKKANRSSRESSAERSPVIMKFSYEGLHVDLHIDAQVTKQMLEAWIRHRQENISAPLTNIVELFLERKDQLGTVLNSETSSMDRTHFSLLGNNRLFREQFYLCYGK